VHVSDHEAYMNVCLLFPLELCLRIDVKNKVIMKISICYLVEKHF
jgi:hypothetical protein